MRLCNETSLTSDAPPPQGVLQAQRPPAISAGSADQAPVVLLSCSTMLPVKAGTGTDGIFTSSPLDDARSASLKKRPKIVPFCQIMPKNLLAQSIRAQHSEMMELALDTPRSRRVTAWIRVIRPSDQGASAGRLMPRCWAGSRPSCGLGTTPWRRKGRGTRERAGTAGARRHPMHLSVSGRTHDDGDRRQRHWCGGCCSLSGRP